MYRNYTKRYGVLKRHVYKFLLIMRLTIFILMTSMLQVSTASMAQKITYIHKNVTLVQLFKVIKSQTGYNVVWYEGSFDVARTINANFKETPLDDVMGQVLKGQPLSYSIDKQTIVIKEKESTLLDKVKTPLQFSITVTGKVTDTTGAPLVGASIQIKGQPNGTQVANDGTFKVSANVDDEIMISFIGYRPYVFTVTENITFLQVVLHQTYNKLTEVVVSTGYQILPKEKVPGSFVQVDNKLLNRRISTNILDRLDGITSGLIFNKNTGSALTTNSSTMSIRGRSTIYANPNPLIVIDNFPYNGDLSSINPNDVESITVLKDASAAAIWGAFSGNGVIVITTKKGRKSQAPKIEINNNITLGDKPNLWYSPQLSSSDYIDIERYLFNKGYYNFKITSNSHPVISPIIQILLNRRNNLISTADSATLINQYKGQDTRYDISQYLYRKSINQQYNVNVSGGGNNNVYYFSAGFDKDLNSLQRNEFNRVSINGSNTYTFLNKKLELSNVVYFTKNTTDNNGISSIGVTYPYLKLKDENGNSSSIPYSYRKSYVDTLGHGNLLDWNYRPLDELGLNNNTTRLTEYRINTTLRYTFFDGLNASIQYQYDQGNSDQENIYDQQSYYTRNYINQFTQYSSATGIGIYTSPVPLGGILDKTIQTFSSQNFRGQLNYSHQWNALHSLSALAGYEIRDINTDYSTNRLYGYTDLGSSTSLDYNTIYTLLPANTTSRINSNVSQLGTTNRFLSYFTNLVYTFKDRYILSASGRKDESNLFGVATNQKGVPLWSIGGSWELSKESFYRISWLPYLRVRVTNGYQGNVDNSLSSLITAKIAQGNNNYNNPFTQLLNPPNPNLRWEKVNTTNFGADFSIMKFLNGNIEYYVKKATDLIGTSLVDPTTGVTTFTGNSADMTGKGLDIVLNSSNLKGRFRWNTTLLFSYSKEKITKYLLTPTSVSAEIGASINPIVGNPLYSVYAFKWGGLDAVGDPQVYLDGKFSKDYSSIYYSPNLSNLEYIGTANPTTFGSLRNDFSWKQFSLSVNITYKFGYYFRRPAMSYSDLFAGAINFPDADYVNRWQKPGDEARTNIPAISYPANSLRDQVYRYSSILIDKGDHVRLQDISLGYDITKRQFPNLPFTNVRVYAYINNIGILWKANKDGIDPDYVPNGSAIYPTPRTYALGLKVGL